MIKSAHSYKIPDPVYRVFLAYLENLKFNIHRSPMLLIFMLIFELINEERVEITIFVTLLLDIEQSYLTFPFARFEVYLTRVVFQIAN